MNRISCDVNMLWKGLSVKMLLSGLLYCGLWFFLNSGFEQLSIVFPNIINDPEHSTTGMLELTFLFFGLLSSGLITILLRLKEFQWYERLCNFLFCIALLALIFIVVKAENFIGPTVVSLFIFVIVISAINFIAALPFCFCPLSEKKGKN